MNKLTSDLIISLYPCLPGKKETAVDLSRTLRFSCYKLNKSVRILKSNITTLLVGILFIFNDYVMLIFD